MKRNLKYILPLLIASLALFSFNLETKEESDKDKMLVLLLENLLSTNHFSPVKIDNDFSIAAYNNFIESLDPAKRYFTQKDIDDFSQFKLLIDDEIRDHQITFFNYVYGRFSEKLEESQSFYQSILNDPYDFEMDETIDLNHENAPFAANKKELKDRWRKQLKFSTISRLHDKISEGYVDEKGDTIQFENLSKEQFVALEKEARAGTLKTYNDFFKRMKELNHVDYFSTYLNSITAIYDPHTSYFPPRTKKQFDERLSGKLEGIGARLSYKNDYTKVTELITGGPAWKAGELEPGDLIIKVAQGSEEPVDIVGMRLDEAIELIKGPKGTEVQLTLKKIDGSINVISIIRDIVEIEETFVKSSVIEKNGKKYGVINLPGFYIDFNDKNARNCAKDMAIEIDRLKEENIDGVLIDLRNNGGGSLPAVVEMAGLFIKDGPIVQVKYKDEEPIVQKDRNKEILWNGPMVVLTNELSASASEIFAAAMQDYGRAVIIGSKQTYGKGTVQTVMDLNRYINYPDDLGGMTLTIQKFYRVNGGSTQLEGVKPDVVLPTRYTYMDVGEKDYKNPLPWDHIPKANYYKWNGYENMDSSIKNSQKRINNNPQFTLIDENAKWLKKNSEDTDVYLNYSVYSSDLDRYTNESKTFEKINKYKTNLTFKSPLYEVPLIKIDTALSEKRTVWHTDLSHDAYIEEGINILEDLKVKPNF